jgi:hypothetical protein
VVVMRRLRIAVAVEVTELGHCAESCPYFSRHGSFSHGMCGLESPKERSFLTSANARDGEISSTRIVWERTDYCRMAK